MSKQSVFTHARIVCSQLQFIGTKDDMRFVKKKFESPTGLEHPPIVKHVMSKTSILGLQPSDKAAMAGVKLKQLTKQLLDKVERNIVICHRRANNSSARQ